MTWSFCASMCTDRAAPMTGQFFDFTTQVKEVASEYQSMHCVINGETPTSWKMSSKLNIFQGVIKTSNHIKAHSFNLHLFMQLWENGWHHTHCLMHRNETALWMLCTHSFWVLQATPEISFGKIVVIGRIFQWHRIVAKLAYSCDIFNLLRNLNQSVQGRIRTMLKSADKVATFKAKVQLWE